MIQTEHLDEAPAAWLSERCDLVRCPSREARFSELLARASGLLVRTYTRVDDAMLAAGPKLRVVARAGVGLENIDLKACERRGVRVVHAPEANLQAVAEYVVALLMDAIRPRMSLDAALPDDRWHAVRQELTGRRQVNELTLGILGFGRIGRRVARSVGALGGRVLYHDLLSVHPDFRWGARPVPRDELLRSCDVLTIHVDARPENRRIVNADLLAHLRDDAIFINTARGMLVNNQDLAEFLRSHPAAMAMLDVHDPEPFGPDYPLLNLPNARLSPHLAAATRTAQEAMSWVVRDVWRVLQNEEPEFPAPACW